MRIRFDPDLLDADDPFEIDEGNRAHLYKHLPIGHEKRVAVGVEDIFDVYHYGDPMYDPAQEGGAADWLMIGEIPEIVLIVPLAPPRKPDPKKCRPIGIYGANEDERRRHREWMRR